MAGALYLADFGSWSMTYTAMAGCMVIGLLATLWCREPAAEAGAPADAAATYGERLAAWFKHAVADPFADFYARFGRYLFLILVFVWVIWVSLGTFRAWQHGQVALFDVIWSALRASIVLMVLGFYLR